MGVPVLDRELLPLTEGEAPLVSDAVGDPDSVELEDRLVLGVRDPVAVAVPEPVAVAGGRGGGVGLSLEEEEALLLREGRAEELAVPELLLVSVLGGVALLHALSLPAGEAKAPPSLALSVGLAEGLPEREG